jgi:hypothetical protein
VADTSAPHSDPQLRDNKRSHDNTARARPLSLCPAPSPPETQITVALKKSELYSSLWSSCDELRGGMDASQYKDYVLVLLFIKYVSDKYAGVPYASIVVPPGATACAMC